MKFINFFFKQGRLAIENKSFTVRLQVALTDYSTLVFLKRKGFVKSFRFIQRSKTSSKNNYHYNCIILIPNVPSIFYRWSNSCFFSNKKSLSISAKKINFLESKGLCGIIKKNDKIFFLNETMFNSNTNNFPGNLVVVTKLL